MLRETPDVLSVSFDVQSTLITPCQQKSVRKA